MNRLWTERSSNSLKLHPCCISDFVDSEQLSGISVAQWRTEQHTHTTVTSQHSCKHKSIHKVTHTGRLDRMGLDTAQLSTLLVKHHLLFTTYWSGTNRAHTQMRWETQEQNVHIETGSEQACLNQFTRCDFDDPLIFTLLCKIGIGLGYSLMLSAIE